jgi:CheY-like chemotaxis protein
VPAMPKILFVEDNLIFQEAFGGKLLRQFPALTMVEVLNGEEALREIEKDPPDLVITDMHLSGMNGFQLTREIKKSFPDISVVIITGNDFPEYREAALNYGADGFWGKETLEWDEVVRFVKKIET